MPDKPKLRIGEWDVDPMLNHLVRGDDIRKIQPLSMDILCYLAERAGEVVAQDELLEEFWTERVVASDAVHRRIADLRRHLGDSRSDPRYIETIQKRGYRLIADVQKTGKAEVSNSIAVLCFEDVSTDVDQAALCFGISEEIIHALSRSSDVLVIARTSSFAAGSASQSVREIGARLGVTHVLEGSVMREANQIRVNARLVETSTERQCWTGTYTKELLDVFSVYDELVADICRNLRLTVPFTHSTRTSRPTQSEAAQNLVQYAKYRYHQNARPEEALSFVEQALEHDPGYVDAHVFHAALVFAKGEMGKTPAQQAYRDALEEIEHTLSLDSNNAKAHTIRGNLRLRLDLDFRLAQESYAEAERLGSPPSSFLDFAVGHYAESLEAARFLAVRDPTNAMLKVYVGRALDRLGRVDEASQEFELALRQSPINNFVLGDVLSHYIFEADDLDRAQEIADSGQGSRGIRRWASACISMRRGDPDDARKLVEEWTKTERVRGVRAVDIELMYFRLGDYAEHIRWFAKRVENMEVLFLVPDFLRTHPDYWKWLHEWALQVPDEAPARLDTVNTHRQLIDRITERMVL